jgi:hypothetical protein
MTEDILMLKPKNWNNFQHYKDRCPPWIKLHRDLLNNKEFMRLPTASKALAPMFWLLASESRSEQGVFDASDDELEFRLRLPVKDIQSGRKSLIEKGFFEVASGVLAERLQDAIPEERRGERETEKNQPSNEGFEPVYQAYPKKVAKSAALKAWNAAKIKPEEVSLILSDIATRSQSRDWLKDEGQFIPNPATYINQRRWEDVVSSQKVGGILAGAI